jgi:hypothetical protein
MNQKGFATLLVVVVLGAMTLSLVIWISSSSSWSANIEYNNKISAQSKALVNACAETALDAIRQNNALTGSTTVTIAGQQCTYIVTNTGSNNRTIVATAVIKNISRKIQVQTTGFTPSLTVASWNEIP